MVKEWGNDLTDMFNSAITPREIPWPNKSPASLSTANRVVPHIQIWFFMDVQLPHAAAFLIFRAHLEEESILPRSSTTTAFLPHSVRTHCSLKLKVPDYHWPAQPACSRTYFTLVSGFRRPPRSFVCLHMLGFSAPTFPEGLHTMGAGHLVKGPCLWGMGVQLFFISERIYSTCSASAAEVEADTKCACDIRKTHAFMC